MIKVIAKVNTDKKFKELKRILEKKESIVKSIYEGEQELEEMKRSNGNNCVIYEAKRLKVAFQVLRLNEVDKTLKHFK